MSIPRPALLEDAAALLELKHTLDRESRFMMLEPDERATTLAEERAYIGQIQHSQKDLLLVATQDPDLAGYLEARGGEFRRNRHVTHIVLGARKQSAGRGIATSLFEILEARSDECGFQRLELTVMVHNQPALNLYQKLGFAIEGCLRNSMFVDNQYVDEYLMAKLR